LPMSFNRAVCGWTLQNPQVEQSLEKLNTLSF